MWSVRFAFVYAAVLAVVGLAVTGGARSLGPDGRRRAMSLVPYLWAAGGLIALYAIWQFTLDVLLVHTAGAVGRGRSIAMLERHLHLPSEASLQRLALHAPWLVKLANDYYADIDFPGLCACLLWLFARHRDRFVHHLAALIGLTAVCTFIQAVPVAPPRLVPGFGFVDTATLFHQVVYPPGASQAGVLTTMPSVHVAWATWVAVTVCQAGVGRWRWALVAHPVLTVLVVVVTGNHFWADAVVALVIVGITMVCQYVVVGLLDRYRRAPKGPPGARRGRRGSASGGHGYDARANDQVTIS